MLAETLSSESILSWLMEHSATAQRLRLHVGFRCLSNMRCVPPSTGMGTEQGKAGDLCQAQLAGFVVAVAGTGLPLTHFTPSRLILAIP